jgi:hypothetical protein
MFPCPGSMSPCFMSLSPCLHVRVFPFPQAENGTNRKRKIPFVFCKRKTETANFRSFAVNGNGSLFSLLAKDFQFLFQQQCPSMSATYTEHFCLVVFLLVSSYTVVSYLVSILLPDRLLFVSSYNHLHMQHILAEDSCFLAVQVSNICSISF